MIEYKSTGEEHIACKGVHCVAVEGTGKRIPKKTKEYLAEKLEDVIEFRDDPARKCKKGD